MPREHPRKKLKVEEDDSSSSSSDRSPAGPSVAAVRPFQLDDEDQPVTLHKAAVNGDVDTIIKLLDLGVNIDIRDSETNTALHCAVEHNREEVVKLLLERGANFSLRGLGRDTPMHVASYFGDVNIIKCLIERGAKLDMANFKGQTPLILACMNGHFECVQLLLESGADSLKVDSGGRTPLMYAAQLSRLNESSHEGNLTPDPALEVKYLQIAEILIDKGTKVNAVDLKKQSALHIAAANGNVKMISMLHKAGADHTLVDDGNRTPLDEAGFNGHNQAVCDLLEFLPEGTVPLASMEKAALRGHINFVKLLFKAFSPGAFFACPALCKAASRGHLKCVQLLIDAGFNVNQSWWTRDHYYYPLSCSSKAGKIECLRELLKSGADVNKRYNDAYKTALHFAVENGHKDCIEELLKAGAKHLLYANKYPWQMAKNSEIQQLLQDHQHQQQ